MSFDLKLNNGDLSINNGDLGKISGQSKLIQDLLKITLTPVGANVLQPWYGSFVSKTLIGSHLPTDIVVSMATSQLRNAIENLKNLQALQANTLQKISPDELIAAITEISVNRNNIDPRLFDVIIKVLSKAFNVATASFRLSNF